MMKKKIIDKPSILIIILMTILFGYLIIKKNNRIKKASYCKGVSLGTSKGSKGNVVLKYYFVIDGQTFNGFVPGSFCATCDNCCVNGNAVLVRYQDDDPENNDLVLNVP